MYSLLLDIFWLVILLDLFALAVVVVFFINARINLQRQIMSTDIPLRYRDSQAQTTVVD